MQKAEDSEQTFSYCSSCRSEASRKKTGSYYTPSDASLFFWTEFLALNGVNDRGEIADFWANHHFIEPSVGAGALVLALFKKGAELGLSLHQLALIELTIIDVNQAALNFVRNQLSWLERKWGLAFCNIQYICCNFLECRLPLSQRTPLFFGNPPFVTNSKGGEWRNLFADFLSRALGLCGPEGRCHFILPLSVAFSRDYARLRSQIRATGKSIALCSFDNIPDTLFPSGKPEHNNTNKANSQRCSILSIFPSKTPRILSTKMHRWRKEDRNRLLSSPPQYHDVTDYCLDEQFPRPENAAILRYLRGAKNCPRFRDITSNDGQHNLFVATVARNFIGFREDHSSSVHNPHFSTKRDFYVSLLILSSDVFLDYWRTTGDGFHVTRANVMEFPLHQNLMTIIEDEAAKGRKIWETRMDFAKTKRHPNGITTSYDFSPSALSLINHF